MVGFMKSAMNLFGIKKEGVEGINLEEFLTEFPQKIGYDIEFENVDKGDGKLHFEIKGSEVDSFLGEDSNMLEALSHVSMRILRKTEGAANTPIEKSDSDPFSVHFDANGFREKKVEELQKLAEQARKKVIDLGGKPSYISARSPSERKVIHTHLVDLGEVTSESIGKGNFKRIRVKLKEDSTHYKADNRRKRRPQKESGSFNNGGGNNRKRSNRSGGRGPKRDRFNDDFNLTSKEVDGNRIESPREIEENSVEDNIGNRLAPGEKSPYSFNQKNGDNQD